MSALPNIPAGLFNHLATAWHHDTTSECVDQLAADLTARVANAGGLACLGLIRVTAVRSLYGLALHLEGYGLTLGHRYTHVRQCHRTIPQPQ